VDRWTLFGRLGLNGASATKHSLLPQGSHETVGVYPAKERRQDKARLMSMLATLPTLPHCHAATAIPSTLSVLRHHLRQETRHPDHPQREKIAPNGIAIPSHPIQSGPSAVRPARLRLCCGARPPLTAPSAAPPPSSPHPTGWMPSRSEYVPSLGIPSQTRLARPPPLIQIKTPRLYPVCRSHMSQSPAAHPSRGLPRQPSWTNHAQKLYTARLIAYSLPVSSSVLIKRPRSDLLSPCQLCTSKLHFRPPVVLDRASPLSSFRVCLSHRSCGWFGFLRRSY
jgi:hypothetical protein